MKTIWQYGDTKATNPWLYVLVFISLCWSQDVEMQSFYSDEAVAFLSSCLWPLFPHLTDGVTKLSKSHKKWPNFQKNKCSSLKRFWTKMKIMILTRVWSVRSAWVAICWITRTAGDHSCHYRCHLQHYHHHFNDLSDQPARGVGRTRERLSDVTTSIGALQRTLL